MDSIDRYEIRAAVFHQTTGYIAPGKYVSAATWTEAYEHNRKELWNDFNRAYTRVINLTMDECAAVLSPSPQTQRRRKVESKCPACGTDKGELAGYGKDQRPIYYPHDPGDIQCQLNQKDARITALAEENAKLKAELGDWYVTNHDNDDSVVRGPYDHSETAGAVRGELERTNRYKETNLWIIHRKEPPDAQ